MADKLGLAFIPTSIIVEYTCSVPHVHDYTDVCIHTHTHTHTLSHMCMTIHTHTHTHTDTVHQIIKATRERKIRIIWWKIQTDTLEQQYQLTLCLSLCDSVAWGEEGGGGNNFYSAPIPPVQAGRETSDSPAPGHAQCPIPVCTGTCPALLFCLPWAHAFSRCP